jgi:hypothetical protein
MADLLEGLDTTDKFGKLKREPLDRYLVSVAISNHAGDNLRLVLSSANV